METLQQPLCQPVVRALKTCPGPFSAFRKHRNRAWRFWQCTVKAHRDFVCAGLVHDAMVESRLSL